MSLRSVAAVLSQTNQKTREKTGLFRVLPPPCTLRFVTDNFVFCCRHFLIVDKFVTVQQTPSERASRSPLLYQVFLQRQRGRASPLL